MRKQLALLAAAVFSAAVLAQPATAPSAPASNKKAAADCKPRHDHRAEKQQIGPGSADCAAPAPARKASGPAPHEHRKEK